MKISDALICIDCDEIYALQRHQDLCPKCLSKYSVPVKSYILPMRSFIKEELMQHKLRRGHNPIDRGSTTYETRL